MATQDLNRELNGLNPLSYMGVNPTTPPQLVTENRVPTSNDYVNFIIGTIWMVSGTNSVYILTAKNNNIATWTALAQPGHLPPVVATGDILAGTAPNVIGVIDGTSADSGDILTGNGSGILPSWQNGSAINLASTQYAVQVGASDGKIASLSSNGNVGQLLTSGGASANPTWSTTSFPAATVDTGDILASTSTNVVGVIPGTTATNGYVLTANGSGSVPTWQAPTGGGTTITINPQTSNYVLQLTDAGALVTMTVTTTANTVTIPLYASVAFPVGTIIWISQLGTGITQVIPVGGGVTINSAGSATHLYTQYSICSLINLANDVWLLTGDLI